MAICTKALGKIRFFTVWISIKKYWLFVNSWGKEIKQNQQSKQLQSSGCLIFMKFLMGENM